MRKKKGKQNCQKTDNNFEIENKKGNKQGEKGGQQNRLNKTPKKNRKK